MEIVNNSNWYSCNFVKEDRTRRSDCSHFEDRDTLKVVEIVLKITFTSKSVWKTIILKATVFPFTIILSNDEYRG